MLGSSNSILQVQGAAVVAHLVEWSLTTPEMSSSIPDIGKFLSTNCKIENMKIKKKRPGMAHFRKKLLLQNPNQQHAKFFEVSGTPSYCLRPGMFKLTKEDV